jgi:MscS family membrane protein
VEILSNSYFGNSAVQWLLSLGIIVGSIILSKILYWLFANVFKDVASKTKTRLDDVLVDRIEEPVVFAVIIAGIYYALHRLHFTDTLDDWIGRVYFFLIVFNIAWLINRLLDSLIDEYLAPIVQKTEGDLDDQLLPLLRKVIHFVVWGMAIVIGLNNAGYDVGALIAGLGIGGLAFALAAQDSVANLFGGLTVFFDKPFTINDRIKISGFDGFVKEVGIRSTRVKTLAGRIVTIPNKEFTASIVENVSSEPSRKVVQTLGLTYDMDASKVERAIQVLTDIHAENIETTEDNVITFTAFGDFSLNILFIYYIKKESDIMVTQSNINMQILKRFAAEGLDFAFPSQTIYTKKTD